MISVSAAARSVIDSGTFEYQVRATSWLREELLGDVPVDSAVEETDRSLNVPERLTLTVPRESPGILWAPTEDDSPLAANGQTLKISIGIGVGRGVTEWFQRGEFLIFKADELDETIEVNAVGLLYLLQEAVFVGPFQPTGTIDSTVRGLMLPAVEVDLSTAPADRAVPSGMSWDTDRLGALYQLLDAWPAIPHMHELGYLKIVADTTPTVAVRDFTDGTGGTMISAVGSSTRDGGFNVVVATGNAVDGTEVRGLAYVDAGPWSYLGGAANPLPVPFGYSSPLLTTQSQCAAAARTVLRRKMREAVLRRYTVTCQIDPTLQIGDPVSITNAQVTGLLCTIERLTLPYTPGPMVLQVVSVS